MMNGSSIDYQSYSTVNMRCSKFAYFHRVGGWVVGWVGGWSELDNKDHLSWAGLCWAWQKLSLNEVSNKNKRKFLPWWQLSSLLVQFHKSHQLVTTHLRGKSTLRGKKIISAKAIRAPMKVSYDDLHSAAKIFKV